jgi:hypothetical protein
MAHIFSIVFIWVPRREFTVYSVHVCTSECILSGLHMAEMHVEVRNSIKTPQRCKTSSMMLSDDNS